MDGKPRIAFDIRPTGLPILAPGSRGMALTAKAQRSAGESNAMRTAPHRSVFARNRRYRVEGNRFAGAVDA